MMNNGKITILAILGAIFLFSGFYFDNVSFKYLGIGTWFSGLVYYTLFKKYKEIASLIIGLVILHSGVILLLIKKLSYQDLLGFLVFTAGIVVVLNSGFSDYIKRMKKQK